MFVRPSLRENKEQQFPFIIQSVAEERLHFGLFNAQVFGPTFPAEILLERTHADPTLVSCVVRK